MPGGGCGLPGAKIPYSPRLLRRSVNKNPGHTLPWCTWAGCLPSASPKHFVKGYASRSRMPSCPLGLLTPLPSMLDPLPLCCPPSPPQLLLTVQAPKHTVLVRKPHSLCHFPACLTL